MTFNENLDPDWTPAGGAFTVSGGRTGTGTAAISTTTATVVLDSAVSAGETVTVSYVKPASNPLRDAAGNEVASFSGQPVTNNTPGGGPPAASTTTASSALLRPPPHHSTTSTAAACKPSAHGDAVVRTLRGGAGRRGDADGLGLPDPDEDPLAYAWSASAGVIAEAADSPTARWTAPATAGRVAIRVEVSDGEGGTAAAEVSVDVLVVLPEQMSFDLPDRGAATSSTGGEAGSLRTGYGRIRPVEGMATASGIALFQFRDPEGVLITEAAVPAAAPRSPGTDLHRRSAARVTTAVAFANPDDRPAEISFYVTDTARGAGQAGGASRWRPSGTWRDC